MKTQMTYRSLGKSGIKVSSYSLGGWTTFGGSIQDKKQAQEIILKAYEAGINFFDIADVYANGASEVMMGETLRTLPRHRLVISSKVFWPMSDDINDKGLSRKHILESIEKSLKRIGTDYLDLYFCHRFDSETPLEETVRAMDDLVHQGKVLYWGTSEWTGDQLEEVNALCRSHGFYRPQVEQPQYNLITRKKFEMDVAPVAHSEGMGLVTWSPLASGTLTGKYDAGVPQDSRLANIEWLRNEFLTPKNIERVLQMKKIADELGCSRSQLALAWTHFQESVSSVILGATKTEQLQENLGALNVKMTADVDKELKRLFSF
ncbi:MAG: aldo/keto reductase [Pseudobdellovibrionaceae bacterium]